MRRRSGPPRSGALRSGALRSGALRSGPLRSGPLRSGAVVLAVVALSACGAGPDSPSGGSASASVSSEVDPSTYGDPVGVGCAGVPAGEGKGSFVAMRGQNVADAIADNPLLTNFAAALAAQSDVAAQLAKANDVTLFVPTDAAFTTLPPETTAALLADPPQRAALIDYAVVAERVVPPQLTAPFSVPTLAGPDKKLTFALAGGVVVVNGQAQIVCSNILTANATIYLVDKVLLPPA